jgi:hypothetical protein
VYFTIKVLNRPMKIPKLPGRGQLHPFPKTAPCKDSRPENPTGYSGFPCSATTEQNAKLLMAPDHYWRTYSMHTWHLTAASTLVLSLCTLQVSNSAACDFGCGACGGYGYSDLDFAYSSYPTYGYDAPVYYLPTNAYAYYPVANYYVSPDYGPDQYAPPRYGYSYQPYRRDYYWPGYVSAPKHTRIVRIDSRPGLRGYAAVKQSHRALKSIDLGPDTAPQVKNPTTQIPVIGRPKVTVDVKSTAIGPTHLRRAELHPYEIVATRAAAPRPAIQRSFPAQVGGK